MRSHSVFVIFCLAILPQYSYGLTCSEESKFIVNSDGTGCQCHNPSDTWFGRGIRPFKGTSCESEYGSGWLPTTIPTYGRAGTIDVHRSHPTHPAKPETFRFGLVEQGTICSDHNKWDGGIPTTTVYVDSQEFCDWYQQRIMCDDCNWKRNGWFPFRRRNPGLMRKIGPECGFDIRGSPHLLYTNSYTPSRIDTITPLCFWGGTNEEFDDLMKLKSLGWSGKVCFNNNVDYDGCGCAPNAYEDNDGICRYCSTCGAGKSISKACTKTSNTECAACGAGKYNEQTDQASCKPCAAGTFSGTGSSSCPTCPDGWVQPSTGKSSCNICAAGTYKDGNTGNTCKSCAAGTFSGTGSSSCPTCPGGWVQPSTGKSSCTRCDAGTYKDGNTCKSCAAGTFSGTGSSSCTGCAVGKYNAQTNQASCKDCAAGMYSGVGSSSCSSCAAGKYQSGNTCNDCPVGRYSISGSCINCPAGKYQSQTGKSTCKLCSAGMYSGVKARRCSFCPWDKWSPKGSESCKTCAAGRYPRDRRSCPKCFDGYYCSGASEQKQCAAGTYSSFGSSSCYNCAAGKYGERGAPCKNCPAGYGSVEKASSCSKCPAGKMSSSGSICLNCAAGTYNNEEGQANCKTCGAGSVSDQGASSCSDCPAGKESNGAQTQCVDCPAGDYSKAEHNTCQNCGSNQWSESGQASCNECGDFAIRGTGSLDDDVTNHKKCVCQYTGTWVNNPTSNGCYKCEDDQYFDFGVCTSCGDGAKGKDDLSGCECESGYLGPWNHRFGCSPDLSQDTSVAAVKTKLFKKPNKFNGWKTQRSMRGMRLKSTIQSYKTFIQVARQGINKWMIIPRKYIRDDAGDTEEAFIAYRKPPRVVNSIQKTDCDEQVFELKEGAVNYITPERLDGCNKNTDVFVDCDGKLQKIATLTGKDSYDMNTYSGLSDNNLDHDIDSSLICFNRHITVKYVGSFDLEEDECATGFYEENGVCLACTSECGAGFYESTACTAQTNRVCTECATGFYEENGVCLACASECDAGFYESTSCTAQTNRVCTECATGFYEENGVCLACTTECGAGFYESTACTAQTNRICTAWPSITIASTSPYFWERGTDYVDPGLALDCGEGYDTVTTGQLVNGNVNGVYTVQYKCRIDGVDSEVLAERKVHVRELAEKNGNVCSSRFALNDVLNSDGTFNTPAPTELCEIISN